MAKEKRDREQERIDKEFENHKGDFITREVCEEYRRLGEELNRVDCQDVDRHKELCRELQRDYGVTQIEAINIVNGFHIAEYISKYERIKNRTPIRKNK